MKYEWVIGNYTGEEAKRVAGLAHEGIGYILIDESGNGMRHDITVAFRRPLDGPRPEHLLEVLDPYKIDKYEKTIQRRAGARV